MSVTLLKNALILDGETVERGDVLVSGEEISGVHKGCAGFDAKADRVVDCGGKILMPALFNSHTHAAMTLLRGAGADLTLQGWLFGVILPMEERLTPAMIRAGGDPAALEMLRFGTAGFQDMYYHMGEMCESVIASGMKMRVAWPSSAANMQGVYEGYNGAANGRINVISALHAEYTASDADIEASLDFARRHSLPVHVHVSETKRETEECFAKRGKTPARFLMDSGFFEHGGSVAHGVWLNDDDITGLLEKNVSVCHCPVSNLKLGSGVMPIKKLMNAGVAVSLGTDGCASNNNLNLFEELRLAALLHKGIGDDPAAVSSREAFKMATENGARACGFFDSGVIKQGAKADIILVDIDVPHAVPMADPYAHIAYSAQGSDVCMTMVNGKILYENGEYMTIDKERVLFEAKAAAKELAL